MPDIDVVDSTWIGVAPAVVAAIVADAATWRRWWPDLGLDGAEWRGPKGMRWRVRAGSDGLAGTMEIWLEPAFDGVVLHYILRLDEVEGRPLTCRRRDALTDAHRRRAKQIFWALGDRLDPGRTARVATPPGS